MEKNNYENLFRLIGENAVKHKTMGEIAEIQKQNFRNEFFDEFFDNLLSEIDLSKIEEFLKYKKYINFLNDSFCDCFEFSGGQNFRFYHSQNVAFLSNTIAKNLGLNEKEREISIITALFHDIGKSAKYYKNVDAEGFAELEKRLNIDHDEIGADMVKEILRDDFNEEFINIVSSTIRKKKSGTIYANILYDADNMAELGEMEIFRSFYYNSCINETLSSVADFWFATNRTIKLSKVEKTKTGKKTKELMMKKFNFIDDCMNKIKKNI